MDKQRRAFHDTHRRWYWRIGRWLKVYLAIEK